jgi:hypothetical protein
MSFYGIETGLSSFFSGRDVRPENRAVALRRVQARLAELTEKGVLVTEDLGDEDSVGADPVSDTHQSDGQPATLNT